MKFVFNPFTNNLDVVNNLASEISIADVGGYFSSTNVEGALQEVGGSISGLSSIYLKRANNLSDLISASAARTNLGLVAGGAGDIWVEKAGDTMSGLLNANAGIYVNQVQDTDIYNYFNKAQVSANDATQLRADLEITSTIAGTAVAFATRTRINAGASFVSAAYGIQGEIRIEDGQNGEVSGSGGLFFNAVYAGQGLIDSAYGSYAGIVIENSCTSEFTAGIKLTTSAFLDSTSGTAPFITSGQNLSFYGIQDFLGNLQVPQKVGLDLVFSASTSHTADITEHVGIRIKNVVQGAANYGIMFEDIDGQASGLNWRGGLNFLAYSDTQVGTDYSMYVGGLINVIGSVFIGNSGTPTARLQIVAGTADESTAPLKFTAGVNLTTPEAGAMEWDGTRGYLTQTTGPTRQTIAYLADIPSLTGYVTLTGVETLTDKRITPRVVSMTDATSFTPTGDTADINTQANTQILGTLTANAPSGTPVDGQILEIIIKSTNVQTFAWNGIYVGCTTTALPTASTGSTKTDKFFFQYSSVASKWQIFNAEYGY